MILALTFATALGAQLGSVKPLAVTGETLRQLECRARYARRIGGSPTIANRKLGHLPPGVAIHAVLKSVEGCPVNVLVRRGPDGHKLEVPAGPGVVTPAPASEAQRRLEGDR